MATRHYCDKCGREVEGNLLTEINQSCSKEVFEYMNERGLLQGFLAPMEVCPECLQEFNWVITMWIRGQVIGKNPFEKKNDFCPCGNLKANESDVCEECL